MNRTRLGLILSYKHCIYFTIELDSFIYFGVYCCELLGFGVCKAGYIGHDYVMLTAMLER